MSLKKSVKKLKSKKGATMIEFTISMLIFLVVFSAGFDFVMLGYKYMNVSSYANDLVRTMSVQGGAASSAPRGFQGGSSAYKTLNNIVSEKNAFTKTIGAQNGDLKVYVNYDDGTGTRRRYNLESITGFTVRYLMPFEIEVEYTPTLEMLGNYGFSLNNRVKVVKAGISEYVQNYEY